MIVLTWLAMTQAGIVRVADVAALQAALRAAKPGTEIVIAPGTYPARMYIHDIAGTNERPIIVRGESRTKSPVFVSWQLSRVSHIVLRDLAFRNAPDNGLNIDDGGTFGTTHHVTLERIAVSDLPRGNHDGIKLSGVTDFRVSECVVERWGGSAVDMVGCHRGVIAKSTFRGGGDSGVQAKGGSTDISIVRCLFENPGQRAVNLGGSTGREYFRPLDATWEARNLTVEGCTFVGGVAAVAFVGVDGAQVRYNTIYRPERWALRILQETTAPQFVRCRNGRFERNLVVFSENAWASGGVNLGPDTSPETFVFADNFWFCLERPDRSRPSLPTSETGGIYGQDPLLKNPAKGDLGVREDSPARAYGAHALPQVGDSKDG
jgi:hypothetical protein